MRVLTPIHNDVAAASPQGNLGTGPGSRPTQESMVATVLVQQRLQDMDVKIIRDWQNCQPRTTAWQGKPPGLGSTEERHPSPGLQQKIQPLPPVLEFS
jgi:hypothetical protein